MTNVSDADCLILAVSHDEFVKLTWEQIGKMYKEDVPAKERVLIDVKGIKNLKEAREQGYRYWRL